MAATPHAALMDRTYRYQRHVYDLTRKYYLFGRDRMIEGLDVPRGGSVLELGCGTGRNLFAVAGRWPGARLTGLDISAEMLATAEASARRRGLDVTFVQGDAGDFDAAGLGCETGFDRIFVSYALSMIPQWERTVRSALNALAPGGLLHIVDFGQQENLPAWFRPALFIWLSRFHVNPRETLFDEVGRQAAERDMTVRCDSVFRGYAWHITVSSL
jgi:S-adenosylmethionine-diacylgycerolhomoserine-N-methlytransferase